ncbi:MAG: hypothetical protein Q7U34_13065, partial [Anaerolineales bacterium]|nr:hypothetical protein [Anaerolineales bacterium]
MAFVVFYAKNSLMIVSLSGVVIEDARKLTAKTRTVPVSFGKERQENLYKRPSRASFFAVHIWDHSTTLSGETTSLIRSQHI